MTGNSTVKIGAILLAAGGSSRLGRPKQLVEFQGKPLIRRSAEVLAASACSPVVVVLGAEIEGSRGKLGGLNVSICINEDWNVGISSSIKAGLEYILERVHDIDAVLIALCDQPYISTDDFDRLKDEFQTGRSPIVASAYNDVVGVPAIFAREIFDSLLDLKGDQGARYLLRQNPEQISLVAVNHARFDIDTPEDLATNSLK